MSEISEPQVLMVFIQSLKQAASAATTMAQMQQRPQWLQVRDMLEGIRATASIMATSRATPRQDVLRQLDRRRKLKVVS